MKAPLLPTLMAAANLTASVFYLYAIGARTNASKNAFDGGTLAQSDQHFPELIITGLFGLFLACCISNLGLSLTNSRPIIHAFYKADFYSSKLYLSIVRCCVVLNTICASIFLFAATIIIYSGIVDLLPGNTDNTPHYIWGFLVFISFWTLVLHFLPLWLLYNGDFPTNRTK